MTSEPHESEGIRFSDKRRIDPETGEVREPRETAAPAEPADGVGTEAAPGGAHRDPAFADVPTSVERELAERTADLQRLQAEYVNYKRRVDRDREVVRETAVAGVLTALLPVLDDIGRAREHDELHGGFKAVAESLERTVTGLGLTPFGEVGDAFDPRIHEALMHKYADDAEGPTCEAILQVGYRLGERVVRPARVAVVEPEHAPAADTATGADDVPAAAADETTQEGAGHDDR